jgi:hypothetical protein
MLLNEMTIRAPLLSASMIVELDRKTSTTTDVPNVLSGTPDVTWTFNFLVHLAHFVEPPDAALGLLGLSVFAIRGTERKFGKTPL